MKLSKIKQKKSEKNEEQCQKIDINRIKLRKRQKNACRQEPDENGRKW